ncbi:hypothetical protein B0H13DRAFT_2381217 [Mycena leptocephala]|nr:hypothetical protein B0H13DRAFT_2381217 [Mycena leptocephala]
MSRRTIAPPRRRTSKTTTRTPRAPRNRLASTHTRALRHLCPAPPTALVLCATPPPAYEPRPQRPSPLRTPAVATAGQTSSRGAHAPTLKDVAQLSRHAARETRMRCIALSLRALPFGVALREYEDERGREGDSGVAQALPVLIYLLVPTLFPLSSFTPRLYLFATSPKDRAQYRVLVRVCVPILVA